MKKKFLAYCAVCFGISWLIIFIGIFSQNQMILGLASPLMMFGPMLAVLITCKGLGQRKTGISWKIKFKGHWQYILAALWVPVVLTVIGAVLYFVIFPQDFSTESYYFTLFVSTVGGTEINMGLFIALQVVFAVIIGPIINMFFAIGEEAGWRGYMTPMLMQRFGSTKGLIISGIIWAVWHWPLILLTGYEYGLGYWGAPWTGALAMIVFTTALGIFLSFLYKRSECIWIPALAHGSINAVAGAGLYFMKDLSNGYILGPSVAGLISGIPLIILAVVLLRRLERNG